MLGVSGGGEGKKKPLKATFPAWMGCRFIDRVVIMVQWGVGRVCSWLSVVDKFYGGGGQVTKGVWVGVWGSGY